MMRLTPMVKNILIINVAIYLLDVLLKFDLGELFGLRVIFSDQWAPYQFITYMWLHDTHGIWHLLGNMFAVFIFGPLLEQVWGSKRFLIFYLACGIGAGVIFGAVDFIEKYSIKEATDTYLEDPGPEAFRIFILDHRVNPAATQQLAAFSDEYYENPSDLQYIVQSKKFVSQIYEAIVNRGMVGASGAVFGLLMAFAMLFPNTYLYLYFAIPVKAKYVVLAYAIFEIVAELRRAPGDNVAHLAHLGGMLIAYILLKFWQKDTRKFY